MQREESKDENVSLLTQCSLYPEAWKSAFRLTNRIVTQLHYAIWRPSANTVCATVPECKTVILVNLLMRYFSFSGIWISARWLAYPRRSSIYEWEAEGSEVRSRFDFQLLVGK